MAAIGKVSGIKKNKKKTSIGNSARTKTGTPGPYGGNKRYKKKYRGQGKK